MSADVRHWTPTRTYGLWHDRAVFHFLVEETDRSAYRHALDRAVAPGGAVILGTFADDGPEVCSGLPVRRYTPVELAAELGLRFRLHAERREVHVTPGGAVQPFTWVAGVLG